LDCLEIRFLLSPNHSQDFYQVFLPLVDHPEWGMHDFTKDRILKLGHPSP